MAKQRLTDAQLRNQREQALRAYRRIQRTLDTKVEVLERQLDRAIENKERITMRLALGVADNFKVIVRQVNELQKATADMIQIFLS